jgi:hypothetical protein
VGTHPPLTRREFAEPPREFAESPREFAKSPREFAKSPREFAKSPLPLPAWGGWIGELAR